MQELNYTIDQKLMKIDPHFPTMCNFWGEFPLPNITKSKAKNSEIRVRNYKDSLFLLMNKYAYQKENCSVNEYII